MEIDEGLYVLDLPDELKEDNLSEVKYMHDPKRVILFRHFTDALVRVGYLKYGRKLKDLAMKLESLFELIEKRLFDVTNTKSTSKTRIKYSQFISLQENLLIEMRNVFQEFHPRLLELFCRKLAKP